MVLLVFRLRNDLYCVEWGVKLYSLTHSLCVLTVFNKIHDDDDVVWCLCRLSIQMTKENN